MLEQAIALAKAGDKDAARALIRQVVAEDPYNEHAWGWLAYCAKTKDERIAALERVVELNPDNKRARQALDRLKPTAPQSTPLSPATISPRAAFEKTVEDREATDKTRSFPRPLLLVLIIAIGVALGFVAYNVLQNVQQSVEKSICDTQGYLDDVRPILKEWDDVVEVADSTPRMALGGQIERLQDIWKDTRSVDVPVCAIAAHKELIEYMDLGRTPKVVPV